MNITVPWNAMWTGEDGRYELRPCRFVGGKLAVWQPHEPGTGKPMFAEPHIVRQRRSIHEMRCTVCGERTTEKERYWFEHGQHHAGWYMTTEAPVHLSCAKHALKVCPHLRARGFEPSPFPLGARVLAAMVKPESLPQLFGISSSVPVIGQLKLGWPSSSVVRLPSV